MPKPRRLSAAELTALWSDKTIRTDDIAARFGVTRQAVANWAKILGLPTRKDNRYVSLHPKDAPVFRSMWRAGVMAADIADHFGCHRKTVRNTAESLGEQARPVGGRYARITVQQWREEQLQARMRASSAREKAQWKLAEMVDGKAGNWAVAAR